VDGAWMVRVCVRVCGGGGGRTSWTLTETTVSHFRSARSVAEVAIVQSNLFTSSIVD
jgi:hypothetical protein